MYVEWFNQYRGGNLPEPQDLYRMVLPVCKHYIELRYRLLQLFYDAMFKNTIDGLSICRPLFINDPHDTSLYNDKKCFIDNEFFVGNDLLIAPVLEPQSKDMNNGRRDVYLPAGSDWYCFMNNIMPLGSAVEGGTTVRDFDANLNLSDNHINFIVPIYVRAGAVIPTIELEQYVGQLNELGKANPITLNIYPGEGGEYTMYLDDGVSRSSAPQGDPDHGADEQARSEYRETKIEHSCTEKTRKISVTRIHDGYTPRFERNFFVAILHDPLETKTASGCLRSVRICGQEIDLITGGTTEQRSNTLSAHSSNGWYYNENINISFIKVFDDSPCIAITAEYF
jgi:alpha-glucosidase